VKAEKASNVVHTVTIADAVRRCTFDSISPGLYSLVNVPQWSWKEVFEHYNTSGTELIFEEAKRGRKPSAAARVS
jgi:hypothetical protein